MANTTAVIDLMAQQLGNLMRENAILVTDVNERDIAIQALNGRISQLEGEIQAMLDEQKNEGDA